jgi:hypothetical protein
MRQRMHPSGLAALVAVIVTDLDLQGAPELPETDLELLRKALLDRRRNRVEQLARAYYATHECDFDNSLDLHDTTGELVNSRNNRAKLDRKNLR